MTNSFEIDFLNVESAKSGDAIAIRYNTDGSDMIHVVDGGYVDTGDKLVEHINQHFGNPTFIHNVVVTHPDGDHANGLRKVLEEFDIGTLWILRPWEYVDEIIGNFANVNSNIYLKNKLREVYPNLVALEEIAINRGIQMAEPFQGAVIGEFTVMAPSRARFLSLVVESDRTPDARGASAFGGAVQTFGQRVMAAINTVRSAWGEEIFSPEDTSAENEMSVVQFANLFGEKILLTADTGRKGLEEVVNYAPYVGLELPGIDRFQVPHHGSRRNVSTELLDQILGARLQSSPGEASFFSVISASKEDDDHPKNSVIRAMKHRGGSVVSTEKASICSGYNNPAREGWGPADDLPYPKEQEEL